MRRALVLAIAGIVLMVGATHRGNAEGTYDFRRTSWGMSRAEVILSEDELPIHDSFDATGSGVLRFGRWTVGDPLSDFLAEKDMRHVIVEVTYHFVHGRLIAAELQPTHPAPWVSGFRYDDFFELISSWLNRQYGPGEQRDAWRDGPREGGADALVYLGELTRVMVWKLDRTSIYLIQEMDERSQQIRTTIAYVDNAFVDLVTSP